jgi:CO/xanthine dehydrogenase Mo-binding subunit
VSEQRAGGARANAAAGAGDVGADAAAGAGDVGADAAAGAGDVGADAAAGAGGGTGRRAFLLHASVAVGGAFVLALGAPGCGGRPETPAARRQGFSPNAWLTITPDDRIYFYLDRVEMGQGTMTSHATLVAEELEVDPARLHVEAAPADRRYDNPAADLGFQITGGSTSVRTSWEPLRLAGAAAREMLVGAAAARWQVPAAECRAEAGAVVHGPSGRRERYGALAALAARQPVPERPKLKDPRDFRYIGKAVPRLDARSKVDGSGVYGIDVKRPGLLTAVVLRAPSLGAKLEGFDADEARAQPGVAGVVRVTTGVAVVATSYWRARRAAELVRTRWAPGPLGAFDSDRLKAQYRERLGSPAKAVRDDGDAPAALGQGKKVVEAVYEVPYLAHATMEPMNCTAHVRGRRCEIWAPTQSPGLLREAVRKLTGFDEDAIDVHTTLIGGGFGRRLAQDFGVEAVEVASHFAAPVKVVWSREDDTRRDFYRPLTVNLLRGAVDAKGEVSAWFHRIVAQSIVAQVSKDWVAAIAPGGLPQSLKGLLGRGASGLYGKNVLTDPSSVEVASDFAYALPNLRVEYAAVESGVPVGFWRSVGASENGFVVEAFLDELAHAAGRDPYELRRVLLKDAPRHRAVLELAAQKAGWGSPLPPGKGRGIAQVKSFGSHCAQVVEADVSHGRVKVERVVCAIDCGLVVNPDIVRAQIEGAVVFGLSAALHQQITFREGRPVEGNFHQYPLLRMHEMPRVEVHIVASHEPPTGVGEVGLPPVAPALANAIFAASGRRLRSLPLAPALAKAMG